MLHKPIKTKPLQPQPSTTADYARRLLIAEQLVLMGCKWPNLRKLLAIKSSDAHRLVSEIHPGGELLSRLESGMYWFRAPGNHNLRMLHASFIFQIHSCYEAQQPNLTDAEKLLRSFRLYKELIDPPVIDNINRAYYLLDSIQRKRGFLLRDCKNCQSEFVAIGGFNSIICPACERNTYLSCQKCGVHLEDPYSPGRNGNKKQRCAPCAAEIRKERRRQKRLRNGYYESTCALSLGPFTSS